jgi:hypothetical protein
MGKYAPPGVKVQIVIAAGEDDGVSKKKSQN